MSFLLNLSREVFVIILKTFSPCFSFSFIVYYFSCIVEVGVSVVDTDITLTEGEEREVCLTTLGNVETNTPITISVIPGTADKNGRCCIAMYTYIPTNNSSHNYY